MIPLQTIYRLSTPQDVAACKKIWSNHENLFGKPKKLGWPTIVAERNGKIIGFISTAPYTKYLVCAPLILNGGSGIFTTMRLIEAYEFILRKAGVHGFYF